MSGTTLSPEEVARLEALGDEYVKEYERLEELANLRAEHLKAARIHRMPIPERSWMPIVFVGLVVAGILAAIFVPKLLQALK